MRMRKELLRREKTEATVPSREELLRRIHAAAGRGGGVGDG